VAKYGYCTACAGELVKYWGHLLSRWRQPWEAPPVCRRGPFLPCNSNVQRLSSEGGRRTAGLLTSDHDRLQTGRA